MQVNSTSVIMFKINVENVLKSALTYRYSKVLLSQLKSGASSFSQILLDAMPCHGLVFVYLFPITINTTFKFQVSTSFTVNLVLGTTVTGCIFYQPEIFVRCMFGIFLRLEIFFLSYIATFSFFCLPISIEITDIDCANFSVKNLSPQNGWFYFLVLHVTSKSHEIASVLP